MRRLLVGVQIARDIAAQAAFDRYRGEEFLPGKTVQRDDELVDFIRNYCETLYHPVGTCKMGLGESAVVDPQLRVRTLDRLRIADASIMPAITSGNTNAPAIMIGERCADFILGW